MNGALSIEGVLSSPAAYTPSAPVADPKYPASHSRGDHQMPGRKIIFKREPRALAVTDDDILIFKPDNLIQFWMRHHPAH
jgi:hypothetical protein